MDIRSVLPSQLISENGSDFVVINFGSANLRLGHATRHSPVVIPHCIAHHLSVCADGGISADQGKKGSILEQGFSTSAVSEARKLERDEICQMVELQLKMTPYVPGQEESPKDNIEGWTSIQLGDEESFPWTQVITENPAFQRHSTIVEPIVSSGDTLEDSQVPTPTPHSTQGSEPENNHEVEPMVLEEASRRTPEESGLIEEPQQILPEESKVSPSKGFDLEILEDRQSKAREESPEVIVPDSDDETRKELDGEMVEDSENETQKEAEAAIQEGLEERSPAVLEERPPAALEERSPVLLEERSPAAPEERSPAALVRRSPAALDERSPAALEERSPAALEERSPPALEERSTAALEERPPAALEERPPAALEERPPAALEEQSPAALEERSPALANGSPMETKENVHEGSDVEIHVEVRLESMDNTTSGVPNRTEKAVESPFKYRKYICGDEAMNISAQEPYMLRRPICRGHLNVNQQYSLQQVCDDLYSIWDWVLTEKLSLGSESRQQFSAVLVVPDTLDNREIKEVLSVVLRDLRFRSAVIHQECVAATFGNGISSACVVNMGAQITSVVCVEDGVVLPTTRIVLPFGGEDISRCLLWIQQRWKSWPPLDTDPLLDPLDLQILEHLKESYCLIYEGDQSAVAEIPYHEKGKSSVIYKGSLTALNVPVMGLFYPSILAPEECVAPLRPGFHSDHEDVLDDSVHVDSSKKSETTEVAPPTVTNGGPPTVAGSTEVAADETTGSQGSAPDESALGLSRAIVNSILSIGRPDLQKKLFASIQLVGGTANTRGLVDAVEERVLHDIPADEAVDTVAVLQNRTDGPSACWKGGGVLGILDFARDAWVQQDDWVTGGVRRGCGRKYKDSYTLHSQAFYYSAVVD